MSSFWGRTIIGVAALDPARDPEKSVYVASRNAGAAVMFASEASVACMLASSEGDALKSTMLLLMDRNSTSSAS